MKFKCLRFTSEYGSNFRLMDGDLLPREFAKPARKATSDIKYIRQLVSRLGLFSLHDAISRFLFGWRALEANDKLNSVAPTLAVNSLWLLHPIIMNKLIRELFLNKLEIHEIISVQQ